MATPVGNSTESLPFLVCQKIVVCGYTGLGTGVQIGIDRPGSA
jgi:hypothetical protein